MRVIDRNTNLTAYSDGMKARLFDDEADDSELSECPYDQGSPFADDWWRGYNDWPKHKEDLRELRQHQKGPRP